MDVFTPNYAAMPPFLYDAPFLFLSEEDNVGIYLLNEQLPGSTASTEDFVSALVKAQSADDFSQSNDSQARK